MGCGSNFTAEWHVIAHSLCRRAFQGLQHLFCWAAGSRRRLFMPVDDEAGTDREQSGTQTSTDFR